LSKLLSKSGGLENYLDRLFSTESELSGRHQVDITGLIGQYAHGNEPSHHMAYLYNYTNSPHKTAEIVDSILHTLYFNAPDGLSGNEDCGQMSAWYVLSSLGFYPVSPGSNLYDLGRPIFDKVTISFENNKTLTINYLNNSKENKYIQSFTMNSDPKMGTLISHQQLMEGGVWTFEMGNKPLPVLSKNDLVKSSLPEKFIPLPYFKQENRVFDKTMKISLDVPINADQFEVYYTINGENASKGKKYSKPFEIKNSSTIRAVVRNNLTNTFGQEIVNDFVKKDSSVDIQIETPYANQYAAGGETTLIDGIQGNEEYRTGDWQGYWATNVKANVSFKIPKNAETIGISCLEDTKSWIFAPKFVAFTIDYADGTKETLIAKSETINDEPKERKGIHVYQVKSSKKGIKSINVNVENFGKCPEWHLGNGNDTWIFVDELFFR